MLAQDLTGSPQTSSFTIRMSTSIHDIFTEFVVEEITSQLRRISHAHIETAAIVDMIRSETTSDVYLYEHEPINGRYSKRSSDASLAHANSEYPSIIIETPYSQGQKDLARLADDYVCGSDGNISVILGFDIEYDTRSKRASASI